MKIYSYKNESYIALKDLKEFPEITKKIAECAKETDLLCPDYKLQDLIYTLFNKIDIDMNKIQITQQFDGIKCQFITNKQIDPTLWGFLERIFRAKISSSVSTKEMSIISLNGGFHKYRKVTFYI